ncbi:MAG: hypothetical protein HYY19_08815, partial [Candidatus Rokubacteria bacterium]|nr:hypothetical protein [Candidatus Rokubacteria bacterium]
MPSGHRGGPRLREPLQRHRGLPDRVAALRGGDPLAQEGDGGQALRAAAVPPLQPLPGLRAARQVPRGDRRDREGPRDRARLRPRPPRAAPARGDAELTRETALPFLDHPTLFGHDRTPGLIAFELEGGEGIRVYHRDGERRESRLEPFTPFLLLADPDLLRGWKGEVEVEPLEGAGSLRWLVRLGSWPSALKAREHCQRRSGRPQSAPDAPYRFLSDPVHQHLLLTGKTSFRGLEFRDLRRLALDIEVYCGEGFEFPNPSREGDRIIAVALAESSGWERVLSGKELDERAMLEELGRLIRERDPDVIEGHNLFRFDLEYIEARARRHRVPLAWGRDGGPLRGHASRMQVAERTIAYRRYEVHGRHLLDTWVLVQHYDVSARDLESYSLKDVALHFGLADPGRTYIDGDRISACWDADSERVLAYAFDDVRETRAVADLLARPYFVEAQVFPYPYQTVVLRGNATKIDGLLLREYLRRRRAIPLPSPARPFAGGYTAIFCQGVARNVLHADVTSLYPSIMLTFSVFPAKDELGVFPLLLRDLREYRLAAKALARRAEDPEARSYAAALQQTFKVLINSFYGYLGFPMGHWNDYEAAERVTATGRELIGKVVTWLRTRGAVVVEIDTDGLYLVPPPEVRTEEEAERFMAEAAAILPEGIRLEQEGVYPAMFSYKMKNYALLD